MVEGTKKIATNKKARHDYHLEESFEAGIVLHGSEVKSLREGKINFKDSYIEIKHQEAFWSGAHIGIYIYAHQFNHDTERSRKLLLHKKEIRRLYGQIKEKGYTLIPTSLYYRRGKVKLSFSLAKGKKFYDKRQDLKKKDAEREMAKVIKHKLR